jgi:hypothetical protein
VLFDVMQILRAGNPEYNKFHFAWTLTNWCNYQCSYCYEQLVMVDKWQKEQSSSNYKLTLTKLKKFDAPFEIELLGGEPTLHPQLTEILTELCSIELCQRIELFTNLSRPLSYFADLDQASLSRMTVTASFHPEYYNQDFIEKADAINRMQHLNIRVSVNISDDPAHWPVTLELIEQLSSRNISYGLHWLHESTDWTPNYTPECFALFQQFETPADARFSYEFDSGPQQLSSLEVYNQNLHRLTGYTCTPQFFEIYFDGTVANTCTGQRFNSLFLKQEQLLRKVSCPRDCCVCESMLNFYKEAPCAQ